MMGGLSSELFRRSNSTGPRHHQRHSTRWTTESCESFTRRRRRRRVCLFLLAADGAVHALALGVERSGVGGELLELLEQALALLVAARQQRLDLADAAHVGLYLAAQLLAAAALGLQFGVQRRHRRHQTPGP